MKINEHTGRLIPFPFPQKKSTIPLKTYCLPYLCALQPSPHAPSSSYLTAPITSPPTTNGCKTRTSKQQPPRNASVSKKNMLCNALGDWIPTNSLLSSANLEMKHHHHQQHQQHQQQQLPGPPPPPPAIEKKKNNKKKKKKSKSPPQKTTHPTA